MAKERRYTVTVECQTCGAKVEIEVCGDYHQTIVTQQVEHTDECQDHREYVRVKEMQNG